MELRQLEILIAISDHGSFSGAARALSTVQSNVSAHISRLEKELTTSLVDRSSGRLTEDGELVVERARRVLNQVQDIAADVNSKDADVEGETVLGCIGTTARWLMPRLLPELTSKFPKIRVTIVEGSTLNLIPRLTSGSLSAGIVHLPIEDDNLQATPLFAEDLVLLVHAKHEWSKLEKITIQELASRPLLLPPKNNSLRKILDRAAGTQRLVLTPQAEIALTDYIARRKQKPLFANARSIKNALDRARMRQANRIFDSRGQVLTKKELVNLEADDFLQSTIFN